MSPPEKPISQMRKWHAKPEWKESKEREGPGITRKKKWCPNFDFLSLKKYYSYQKVKLHWRIQICDGIITSKIIKKKINHQGLMKLPLSLSNWANLMMFAIIRYLGWKLPSHIKLIFMMNESICFITWP